MFIQCAKGGEDKILDTVRSIPEVAYAYKVDKAYDVVIKVESDSLEKFTSAIAAIRTIPGLLNTDTMIGFRKQ
jgi:DNA-binding Lrp family transcriptional regulator